MKVFLAVFLLCSGCASWPQLTGRESLARLTAAAHKNPEHLGKSTSATDCIFDHDAGACAWVSAYWQADYADATKNCESGDASRCAAAVLYAGGCHIRGYASDGRYSDFFDEGGGPIGCSGDSYPEGLVTPPPVSALRALELLATGCRRGDRDSCSEGKEALNNGMIMGLQIPQDFATATAFCLALKRPGDDDEIQEMVCESDRKKETPEARAQRYARVQSAYASAQRIHGAFADQESQRVADQDGATWRAIGLGLSQGAATNASVSESLATTRANLAGATPPARVPPAVKPALAKEQAHSNDSFPGGSQPPKKDPPPPPVVDKRQDYLTCIQTNWNCDDGTSANCRPSVAPTGPYAGGAKFRDALGAAHACSGPWDACSSHVISYIPAELVKNDSNKLARLGERWRALPSQLQSQCPWPSSTELNTGAFSDTRAWCGTTKETCENALATAISTLQNGDLLEECVYYATFSAERLKIADARIAQCSALSGYTPTSDEIAKEELTPPIPSPTYSGPPSAPPPAPRLRSDPSSAEQ